uniref:Receptor expression-enhancing protein n=1 Tax=Leptocylindrus danicus TaxID=163516 RepID=A0A7S2PGD2_9STRA|mmetsp:Transcript_32945/g.47701  ORF Transcript_32945/g.47701 Transcript_32945/m.47701 type:complete len:139 (+) Transcript_32945:64-480(+)
MDMDDIKAQVKAKLGQLRSKLNSVPILQKAEDKVKIPKEYLVLVGGSLLFFLFFFGIGAGSICSIVGFIYPAFKSFEAIESKNRSSDVQWLVYWVIYAFFSVIEKNESKIDAVLNKSKKTAAKAAQEMTKVVAEAKED